MEKIYFKGRTMLEYLPTEKLKHIYSMVKLHTRQIHH